MTLLIEPGGVTDASTGVPRPEYPRPDRDRSTRWLSLNGDWAFESIDGTGTIRVPFAWETTASGIGRTWLERASYRRTIRAPSEWGDARVALCFGAVHHHAVVSIDGRRVGEHTGGYTSFEFDVTDFLVPGAEAVLDVAVTAPADKRSIPHGKQRSIPRDDYDGVAFAPTSGIWQSVWLEARGRTSVETVVVRGDSLSGFDITGRLTGDAPSASDVTVELATGERVVLAADAGGGFAGRIEPTDPRRWSPADPQLHRLTFTVGAGSAADRVTVTSGLRRFEASGGELLLNGERTVIRGVLDQGYWPETGLTAPDDAALMRDLDLARELGFTLVRKHLKLEEPRWLHRADELGMMVWAEPPGPSRHSAGAADGFESQLAPMVERDGNHPSIVIWGLYNEEWGLDWDIPGSPERAAAAAHAYDVLAALDRSRPIVENSGWNHVRTDLVDWHYYEPDPATWAAKLAAFASGASQEFAVRLGPDFVVDKTFWSANAVVTDDELPNLNSEYGEGFTSLERAWHSRWQTQELRRHARFAGYVYTELCDVEHEMAGLLDADRRPKDWGGLVPADVHADTVLIIDLIPARAGADIPVPTAPFALGVRVSHHGSSNASASISAAWVAAGRPADAALPSPMATADPIGVAPFVVSDAVELRVPAPGPVAAARLLIWAVDDAGDLIARTFVDAAEIEPPNRRGARAAG